MEKAVNNPASYKHVSFANFIWNCFAEANEQCKLFSFGFSWLSYCLTVISWFGEKANTVAHKSKHVRPGEELSMLVDDGPEAHEAEDSEEANFAAQCGKPCKTQLLQSF